MTRKGSAFSNGDFSTTIGTKAIIFFVISLISNVQGYPQPIPNAQLVNYYKTGGRTQFMHFSLCTFVNCQWDREIAPPSAFNPTDLDTDQWMSTAALWGANEVCLTVRHVDGFALWPTKSNNYSVAFSPYKNGTGDVVAEFVASARKFNINPCFYIIVGFDFYLNQTLQVNADIYLDMQITAITELLTNYGPITRLWFDNYALDGNKWQPVSSPYFICTNDDYGTSCPGWINITSLVRSLSPNTLMIPGPDGCLVDAENLDGQYPIYHAGDMGSYVCHDVTNPYPTNASVPPTFLGIESDFSILNPGDNWFWENITNLPYLDGPNIWSTMTMKWSQGANVIFNIPPDTTGKIPDAYVEALGQYRTCYDATYNFPVGSLSSAQSGKCGTADSNLTIVITVDPSSSFDQVWLEEDMSIYGQVINSYTIEEYSVLTQQWSFLPILHGITVGSRIIDWGIGTRTNVSALRFTCTGVIPGIDPNAVNATISKFAAYLGAPM